MAITQTYYPIPESNTYWQYCYTSIPMYCPCWGNCYDEQLKVYGDTIINEIIYHKLTLSIISYYENCEGSFYNYGYQGAFRNIEELKQVWFVPEGEQNEELLYDFNLEVGDTLAVSYINPYGMTFYVDEIDSVEMGNSFRKRYKIFGDFNLSEQPFIIIEGIGGQNLIKPLEYWLYFEEGYTFQCININDSVYYPTGEACELMVNTNGYKEKKQKFNISPNPSTGKFWIKNASGTQKAIVIEIFNSIGEKIKQMESNGQIFQIDLSAYSPGIFLIKISWETGETIQKVIIQ